MKPRGIEGVGERVQRVTIGSLFSGIGGLDLGLEHALRDGGFDAETTWQCEADAWCRGILARHWPSAVRYDDVRRVGADNAARVDVLCGGFPCQDVSFAGKGAGLAGERSGLWFEFARIVRELRPRVVVVENVSALVSRGLGRVLCDLAEAGYDALWFDLRASDVGAPHRRERIFVVAWQRDVGDGESERSERSIRSGGSSRRPSRPTGDAGSGSAGVELDNPDLTRRGTSATSEVRAGRNAAECSSEDVADRGSNGSLLRNAAAPSPRTTAEHSGSSGGGIERAKSAQPRLGRVADGIPCGLDSHRWPVGPDEAQPEVEPPRVTTERRERRQRLKALGNAVVPQVGYVVGCVVARVLSEEWP